MKHLNPNLLPKSKKFLFIKDCLLLAVFLVFAFTSNATTYYFSSSLGNDSYTSTQAKSQATPWKSINKLNSIFSTLVAGDSILLKRGDVFYGGIVVNRSGSSVRPIVINAYGSGNKPLISGFATLSSWAAVGNGVYQATTAGISNDVNMVTLDNQPQHIGRTPNIDAVNGGYLNFETSTSTSITDNQLTALPNWTGAEVVVRKLKHVIEHWPITSHSGQTIAYQSNAAAYPTTYNGYGYFIQKDIRCLDQLGEWFYNTSTKYLQMYFGSNNPASSTVKVSTIDILLNTAGFSNITINNIAFEGANINAINIGSLSTTVSKVTVTNCDVNYSGLNGVYATNANYPTVENCTVNNSYNNAIDVENEGGIGAFARIRNNSIKNVGTRAGMGASFGNSHQGITVYGTDALIEYNNVDSAGYMGIAFYYNNAKVRYNYITNYSFVKDDGGGIYTWTGPVGGPVYSGREVKNNILINGIGAGFGTPNGLRTAYGVYMDDGSVGVDMSENSIANSSEAGLYIHNSHEVSVTNNTAYNCDNQQMLFVHDNITPTDPLRNVVFKNNIMVAKTANQYSFAIRSIKDDINQTGPTDSNYYTRPSSDGVVIGGLSSVLKSAYSLEGWQSSFTGKDIQSKKSPKNIIPYKIDSLTANLLTNGDFASTITGISFWSSNSNQAASWDGTSKLTGTGSLRISFPVSTANTYTLCTKSVGALSNGKNYIVRFSTLGTTALGTLRIYLKNTATNTNVVPIQIGSFNSTRKNHEFLFTAPITASAGSLMIEIQQNSGTTYVDDIQFFEAKTTTVNLDGEMRFEFNASTTAKTISLDAKYIGIDGTVYDGTITLQPYTSKVLIKNGAATIVTPPPAQTAPQTLKATAAVPVISCFGGNTTVAVTALGGTAPYTGTGSFPVNAGTGSLKISVATPVAGSSTLVYSSIGAVSNLKSYVFRFSTLATSTNGTSFFDSSNLTAAMRQTNSPWSTITATQSASFGTGRTDHQFIFTAPPTTADASFVIELFQSSGNTYIDNIAFFESTAAGVPITNNLYPRGQMESSISNLYTWSPNNNHLAEYDFTSKIANTYNYLVQDATGAKVIVSAATAQPVIALSAASSAGTITVAGGTTTVVVTATGGTAPYIGTGTFTNINPGTYSYTVTDANGCSSITNVTIAPPLNATANAPAINCFGGNTSVAVTASGGTAPYTGIGSFAVNAGTGSLKISAANPVAGSSTLVYSSIGAVSNLKSYVFRFSTLGTTTNGSLTAAMRQTNSPWLTITTKQSASFGIGRTNHQFIFTAPPATADAGFVIAILQSSGTTYIDNIAFFESTATGVPITNNLYPRGQMESSISNLYSYSSNNNHLAEYDFTSKITNTYNYLVQDAAGAKIIVSAVTAQPDTSLSAASSAGTITIAGGTTSVVVTATGGTAPYIGTGTFTNINPGTYSYTVTDAKGCSSITNITIGAPLNAIANTAAINCFGGNTTLAVTASGGTAPYTGTGSFAVNAGTGSLKISVATPVAGSNVWVYSSIGAVSNLKSYVFRFSTLGTTTNGSLTAAIRQTNSPWSNVTATQSASFGTGRVNHQFIFTAPITTADASFVIAILQSSGTVYIDNIAFFESTAAGELITDNLYSNGQMESSISNLFTWSSTNNHLATYDFTSKITNTYNYLVQDAAGAKIIVSATTTQPATALSAASSAGSITIVGGTTTVVVTATGGTAPYTGTGSFTNVKAGTYSYTVTDANRCTSVTTISVTQAAAKTATGTPISSTSGKVVSNNTLAVVKDSLNIISYPNPTNSEFSLFVKGGTAEKIDISVFSIEGRIVFKTQGPSNKRYAFGKEFSSGMYIIQAIQGKTLQTLKVVKAK